MITLTAVFFASLFAGCVSSLTGFGYAMAAVPFLTLVMDPKDVVMFVLATNMILKIGMVWRTRHEGSFRDIWVMFAASVAGALPGAYIMLYISADMLKILIGTILLVATVMMYKNYAVTIRRPLLAQGVAGGISGFLASTTSLNGPPIMLYYMNENTPKEILRANMARYFLLNNAASILMAWVAGTFRAESLSLYIAISLPALAIGFWLGDKLFYKLDAARFRSLALKVITFGGLFTAATGLLKACQ